MKAAPPPLTELNGYLEAAGLAADGASKILLNYFGNLRNISEKEQAGLVSEADRESEDHIVGFLKKRYPKHRFLGEETGLSGSPVSRQSEPSSSGKASNDGAVEDAMWMIDPLDGTTNYVHQFPVFCISIGLEIAGQLVVGLVDAPKMGLRYTAIRGQGAFLNGERIHVSTRTRFHDGLFATGFSSVDEDMYAQFMLIEACVRNARGIRRAGAAAMDLCFVAQGIFDVFWEKNLQAWDTAAGALIVEEAGGLVTNFEGQPFTTNDRHIIAGTPTLHNDILGRIKQIQLLRGNRP